MDKQLHDDLSLSHGFINALSAALHGRYVFEQALAGFGLAEADARAAGVAGQIDTVNRWWSEFKRGVPLMRVGHELSDDGAQILDMLQQAGRRLKGLASDLMQPIDPGTMLSDRAAVSLRVAAECDAAYSREHYVHGLICYGEVMDMPLVAGRYRQLLPSCQQGVRDAHGYLERALRLDAARLEPETAELLDATLTVPVLMRHRALDIKLLVRRRTGDFGFADAGIEPSEQAGWAELEFTPYAAGQWKAAGFDAAVARAWVRSGVTVALGAASFAWRGLGPAEGSTWYSAGMSGRDAAAWLDAGVDIADAQAWRADGVSHPDGRHLTA